MTSHPVSTKYALYKYSTANVGDEIQSVAARRFLPRVDAWIDRDHVAKKRLREPVRLIANGWYGRRFDNWPPQNAKVEPLLISMHLSTTPVGSMERLLSPEALAYYKRFEPVGCRDTHTRDLLASVGVDAYVSGCLTLTLEAEEHPRAPTIYIVDMPAEFQRQIPHHVRHRVRFVSHILPRRYQYTRLRRYKFWRARQLLSHYARAHLVITTRFHCALPCRAFGTPVILAQRNVEDPRLKGLPYLNACALENLLAGDVPIEWEAPPANPGDISSLRTDLEERCRRFVDSGQRRDQ
ncbi:MAG: polysaccharide pyruvyl transferase family protein [Planctomycetota bacterium]